MGQSTDFTLYQNKWECPHGIGGLMYPQPIIHPSYSHTCGHGEPSVKYRGIFINDEVPVLWNFARDHFNITWPQAPFQTGIYEKMFELILRLKGNYLWPSSEFFSPTHLVFLFSLFKSLIGVSLVEYKR